MGHRTREGKLLDLEEYGQLVINLRYLINLRGLSYSDLAGLSGLSTSILFPLVNPNAQGHSGLTHASLVKLARGLGFPVRDLLYTDLEARDKCFF